MAYKEKERCERVLLDPTSLRLVMIIGAEACVGSDQLVQGSMRKIAWERAKEGYQCA